MKKIGFLISEKRNEKRRALIPKDLEKIKNIKSIYIEDGYGNTLGFTNEDYLSMGANIVNRKEIMNSDIIVDPKVGDANYINELKENRILVGWAHAVQDIQFTNSVLAKKHTVIAWEEMFENGRHTFYRNNEIAGEAAILHAYPYIGKMPYETKVAIIGNGQTAKGALRFLHSLGAEVDVYSKRLEDLFKANMFNYDVIVNCILWDTNRTDRLIYKNDLPKFKQGTMIIDISCDPELEIETSKPTTIDDPVYEVDGVLHYAVDHTPAMFPHTISKILSAEFSEYIDELITQEYSKVIRDALIIENGEILDNKIVEFRKKKGLIY